jgi:hypothetical protein
LRKPKATITFSFDLIRAYSHASTSSQIFIHTSHKKAAIGAAHLQRLRRAVRLPQQQRRQARDPSAQRVPRHEQRHAGVASRGLHERVRGVRVYERGRAQHALVHVAPRARDVDRDRLCVQVGEQVAELEGAAD